MLDLTLIQKRNQTLSLLNSIITIKKIHYDTVPKIKPTIIWHIEKLIKKNVLKKRFLFNLLIISSYVKLRWEIEDNN